MTVLFFLKNLMFGIGFALFILFLSPIIFMSYSKWVDFLEEKIFKKDVAKSKDLL